MKRKNCVVCGVELLNGYMKHVKYCKDCRAVVIRKNIGHASIINRKRNASRWLFVLKSILVLNNGHKLSSENVERLGEEIDYFEGKM